MTDTLSPHMGPYRLGELLGQGSMARVYRCADEEGRAVAVKILHSHLTDDEGFLVRFAREAASAAQLDHPHIVRVLDHGVQDGAQYLVMELVDGPSLRAWLRARGEPLPIAQAVDLVATLADAVQHAHERGVVHRDLKPANVLLRGDDPGDPVLSDFGIARVIDATLATGQSALLGTPAYMAPEQGQGGTGDERSDIYALGVILYELVCGKPPFAADSPYALILQHVHNRPPSPRTLRPDLPSALEGALLRALAKDPGDRFATAAEFARAVRSGAIAAERPRPKQLVYALGGFAVLLLAALVVAWSSGWLGGADRSGDAQNASAAIPPVEVLTLQGAPAIAETWIDSDVPDRPAAEDGKLHLQGPSTPDRLLVRVALPEWPVGAELVTATLSLYTVPWKAEENRSGTVAAYRILRDWDLASATYASPWSAPGLQPGVDYDSTPFITTTLNVLLTQEGWLDLDIAEPVAGWLAGEPNYGLALRMDDDSYGMSHVWVYASEYEDRSLTPKLTLAYRHGSP